MNRSGINKFKDKAFYIVGIISTLIGLVLLALFIGNILVDGLKRINWAFITNLPSRWPEKAGIYSALLGSVWILSFTAIISLPIGIAAGVYLEEYAKQGKLASFIELIWQEFLP